MRCRLALEKSTFASIICGILMNCKSESLFLVTKYLMSPYRWNLDDENRKISISNKKGQHWTLRFVNGIV